MKLTDGMTYIGDGVYAYDDGDTVKLITQREGGWESIYLDSSFLSSLFALMERTRKFKIGVTWNEEEKSESTSSKDHRTDKDEL